MPADPAVPSAVLGDRPSDGPAPISGGRRTLLPQGEGVAPLADLAIAAFVLLSLVAYGGESLGSGTTTLRVLLLWVASGFGIVQLARLAVHGDRAARCLAAFVAVATTSTLLSGHVWPSLYNGLGTDQGLLILGGYACCWAVGRSLSDGGTPVVMGALLVGAGINVVVGVLQVVVHDGIGALAAPFERSEGFLGNPVLYGGVMAGTMVLCASMVGGRRWLWSLGGIAGFAAAVNLSGSRIALAAGLVLVVAAARSAGWRRAGAAGVAAVVGYALTWNVSTSGAGDRLGAVGSAGGSGFSPRLEMWRAALHAVAHRPVLGYGPGRFTSAVGPWTTSRFVRGEGAQIAYAEAHNLFVTVLTVTGVVGLVLVVGFLWFVVRRAHGPLAWYVAGVAATWLLEPMSIFTAPVALVALGVATRDAPGRSGSLPSPAPTSCGVDPDRPRGPSRVGTIALVASLLLAACGAWAGGRYVLVDQAQTSGVTTYDLADLQRAAQLVPHDPSVANDLASLEMLLAQAHPSRTAGAEAVRSARRLVTLDDDNAESWGLLAKAQAFFGDGSTRAASARAVRRSIERAYALNPWSYLTLRIAYGFEVDQHHRKAAERWHDRLCEIDLCPEDERPGR